jgi:membrane protein
MGGLYIRTDEHHLFLMAGGLAFSVFVCIIPFVLVIFFILGSVLANVSLEQQVDLLIQQAIPYKSYANFAKEIILSRVRELVQYKHVYGSVGVLGLVFAASGLFSSMRTILNTIFKVQIVKNEAVGKLRDFGMVFLVLCFFLVSITMFPIFEAVKDATTVDTLKPFQMSFLQQYLYAIFSFLVMCGIFYALYFFVPYGRFHWRVLIWSSLWAAILWEFAEQGFGFYMTHFASMEEIYGAYALLVVVAFWIYYACLTFIVAAELGQLYRERLEGNGLMER